ncbi:MAG: hypothetical protein KF819_11715 [Labilithrix sp.]|nr:hypothetical protein [Labilithrix sp.]
MTDDKRSYTLSELTAIFASFGADDPEGWARSQLTEGINQLARFFFLREAWKLIVSHADRSWIQREREEAARAPRAPGAGSGAALERLLSTGADEGDLTEIVRATQWQLLAGFCALLDDQSQIECGGLGITWALFETDAADMPIARIDGLHESVLETDPAGLEMRSERPQ